MGRYIYKPLVTYFSGKDPEEKKFEFIQAYKNSLIKGELLVDLYNYDIYIANNGLEYPVPSTPELKKEIIEWIESDNGSLGSLNKSDLLNDKGEDNSNANFIRKKEKVESLLNDVKKYNEACKNKIDEDENTALRTNREVENWFENLNRYTIKKIYSSNSNNEEVLKSVYYVLIKYFDLYKRLINVNKYMDYLLNEDTIKLITDKMNLYNDELIDLFKEVVNNKSAVDNKLNLDEIKTDKGFKIPKYEFEVTSNKELKNLESFNKKSNNITNNIKFTHTDNKHKIIISNK